MVCPICQGKTKVVEHREQKQFDRRRRRCISCGNRFTTHEELIDEDAQPRNKKKVEKQAEVSSSPLPIAPPEPIKMEVSDKIKEQARKLREWQELKRRKKEEEQDAQ